MIALIDGCNAGQISPGILGSLLLHSVEIYTHMRKCRKIFCAYSADSALFDDSSKLVGCRGVHAFILR